MPLGPGEDPGHPRKSKPCRLAMQRRSGSPVNAGLPIEISVRVVNDRPNRPDRSFLDVEGNQQHLFERRPDGIEIGEMPFRMHKKQGLIAIQDGATGAEAPRRAFAEVRKQASRDRRPNEPPLFFIEQADACGVGQGQPEDHVDQLLKKITRRVGQFLRQLEFRLRFGFPVRSSGLPALQIAGRDHGIQVERDGRRKSGLRVRIHLRDAHRDRTVARTA